MFAVVISEKGGGERRQVFDKDEILVGRVQSNDLMLPKGNVSKRHATLSRHEGRFVVRDENSTNGTYVNRRRISQATIVRQGDRIFVGDFILRIETANEEELQAGDPSQGSERRSVQPTGLDFSDKTIKTSAATLPKPPTAPPPVFVAGDTVGPSSGALEPQDAPVGELVAADAELTVEPALLFEGVPGIESKRAQLVQQLVLSVFRKLEPGLFDKDMTDAVKQRVSRLVTEQASVFERRDGLDGGQEKAQLVELAQEELLNLGPLGRYLADTSVHQIVVTTDQRLLIWHAQGYFVTNDAFSCDLAVHWAVARLCRTGKNHLNPDSLGTELGLVECELPGGWTLEAQRSAAGGDSSFVILRRSKRTTLSLDDLVQRGDLSQQVAEFLQICTDARRNVLVVASPGTNSQELLGALAFACQDDPLIVVDRRTELVPDAPALRFKPGSRNLAEETLLACRLPKARLVVSRFGGEVGWPVLTALSEGCSGALLATYARSAEAAFELKAAELLAAGTPLRGASPDVDTVRRWLLGLIDIVVEFTTAAHGRKLVSRVAQVVSRDEIELCDLFRFVADRNPNAGPTAGSFALVGAQAPILAELTAEGFLSPGAFAE